MSVRWALAAFLGLLSISCSKPPATSPESTSPATAEQALYQKIRSGKYQLGSSLEPLADAVEASLGLAQAVSDPSTMKAIAEMRHDLERAGSTIGDYAIDLPPYDTFAKEIVRYDEERLQAIEGSNHSILLLNAAIVVIDDMLSSKPPSDIAGRLGRIKELATTARDAVRDAVRTMGGKSK